MEELEIYTIEWGKISLSENGIDIRMAVQVVYGGECVAQLTKKEARELGDWLIKASE